MSTIGSATAGNNTGGATADYTDPQTWNDAIGANTTGTIITKVAAIRTTSLALNAAYTVLFTADTSTEANAPTYTCLTSRARVTVTSGNAVTISANGWTVERFCISSVSGGQAFRTGNTCTLQRMVLKSETDTIRVTAGTVTISNVACLYPKNAGAFTVYVDGGTTTCYQTSIISRSSGIGFYAGSTVNCYGCVCQGTTSNNYFSAGGNYNVAQGTGAPGANSVSSVSGVYTNSTDTTEDLSLTTGSWNSIVNRSGFPADTDTDIVGTSRPSTGADPGVWQTAGGGSTTRGMPFGTRGTAFNGGRTLTGILR